jgi:hypothetical protein
MRATSASDAAAPSSIAQTPRSDSHWRRLLWATTAMRRRRSDEAMPSATASMTPASTSQSSQMAARIAFLLPKIAYTVLAATPASSATTSMLVAA